MCGGAPLVALRDQLEQKLGAGLAQRHEAQLVDYQQFAGDHLLRGAAGGGARRGLPSTRARARRPW